MTDCCTLSNYTAIRTSLIYLEWTIHFPSKPSTPGIISGKAVHTLVAQEPVDHVIFDTSFLDIKRVVNVDGSDDLKYTLADRLEPYGSALRVELTKKLKKGDYAEVSIEYATTEKCTAVQW